MVRLQRRRRRGAHSGKLSSDPAIRTAAVALILGHQDPLGLLGADHHDWNTTVQVIKTADQERLDRDRNLAVITAHELAKVLGPQMQSMVNAVARIVAQGH